MIKTCPTYLRRYMRTACLDVGKKVEKVKVKDFLVIYIYLGPTRFLSPSHIFSGAHKLYFPSLPLLSIFTISLSISPLSYNQMGY